MRKYTPIASLLGCWWFIQGVLCAQVQHTQRYEIDMKNNDQQFLVVSMKENGLALLREKDKHEGGNKLWEAVFLDTALAERWKPELEIANRLNLIGHDYNQGIMHYLFRTGDANNTDLALYKIDPLQREVQNYTIKLELDFRLTQFSMMGNYALFGGYLDKQPLVTIFDLKEGINKVVPGFFLTNSELLDLRPNVNNTFNTLLAERTSKEKRKLILKTFDAAGTLLMDDEIELDADKHILSAICSTLERDEMMIVGTWTSTSGVRQATGFFALPIDPFSQQSPVYYDFGQLQHFFDYLKPKRAAILKENSQSRRANGKVPEFKTYVNPVRVVENNKGFLLLAEVYQPGSTTSNFRNSNYYSPYGLNNPYYNPFLFNPYYNRFYNPAFGGPGGSDAHDNRMIHSVVVEFNANGKLMTDYGVKLNDIKLATVDQASDFVQKEESTTILFKKDKYLRQGSFNQRGELVKSDTVKVNLNAPTETIRFEDDDDGGIRYWYGSAFYMWGYHTVQDISKRGEDRNRYVFYINKVVKP